MSDADDTPATPPGEPLARPERIPPPRHGCLTAWLSLDGHDGIIFLLPGLCVLAISKDLYVDPLFGTVAIVAAVVGIGGIMLIRLALRGQRR
jgi:hypothetical protein